MDKPIQVSTKVNNGSTGNTTGKIINQTTNSLITTKQRNKEHEVQNNTSLLDRELKSDSSVSEETTLNIVVDDLLNESSMVYANSSHQSDLALKIEDFKELTHFLNLIHTKPNSGFIKRIVELNFGSLCIEGRYDDPITITFPESLNGLKKLFVGHIGFKVTLNLPKTLNDLTELVFNGSRHIVNMPEELLNLKKLVTGDLTGSVFVLPEYLDNLEELSLGVIGVHDFKVPNRLDKLKSLTIGLNHVPLEMPDELNSLTKLSIHNFANVFKFSTSMNSLEILEMGSSYGDSYFNLPNSIHTVHFLSIGEVYSEILTIPNSFESIETLHINNNRDGSLQFPESLKNLKNLMINKHNATLKEIDGRKKFVIETDFDDITEKFLNQINERINASNVKQKQTKTEICYIQ